MNFYDFFIISLLFRIKKNLNVNKETPADFLDYLNEWALESIALIMLNKRLGIMENPEASKINKLAKQVFDYSFEYDVLPGIWRVYKTPGFMKAMKTYEKMTGTMKKYADEAMEELEKAKASDDQDAGVLEKLMKVDKHVAFVMALDSLMAGVRLK